MDAKANFAAPAVRLAERRNPAMHVAGLRQLRAYLAARGHDADALLAASGIQPHYLADPPRLVGLRQTVAFIEQAIAATGRPMLGLECGAGTELMNFSWLGMLAATAPNVRVALQKVARYGAIYNRALAFGYDEDCDGGRSIVRERLLVGAARCFMIEIHVVALTRMIDAISGRRCDGVVVDLPYPAPAWCARYSELVRGHVRFDQSLLVVRVPPEVLDQACVAADYRAHDAACRACEEILSEYRNQPVAERVRMALRDIGLASVSASTVAAALSVSERTMNRQLAGAGVTYQALVDEYRKELALWYLQNTDKPLGAIALELGYVDMSNFSRTCRRWFGCAPSALRR